MLVQTISTTRTPRPATEAAAQVAPYCPVPRRMLSDLRDTPLAIGLYLLVARLYLINHAPIPLGRADVLHFDPSLKSGAVKRAFDRLLAGGWLLASAAPASSKRHYMPTWGPVSGVVRPWCLEAPVLGRPHHLETVRLNRDLLDIGLGRLVPHPRHAAEIARYLAAPALSLSDLGAYALALAGLGNGTPTLIGLGLVDGGEVCAVPPALALLRQFVRRGGLELSEHGLRKLGLLPTSRQIVIGRRIGGVIGPLIGCRPDRDSLFSPSGRAERPRHSARATIPGRISDSSDSATPPPTPPASGGGQQVLRGRRAERPKPSAALVPDTDATRLLHAIEVRPAQVLELASLPLTAVEQAIADGRARAGIRDLAGWVVYLLRQRREHGWTLTPSASRADAPEALGTYFARLAAEQEREQETKQADERPLAEHPTKAFPLAAPPAPPPEAAQPPSLAAVWQDTLASLRLRLPREVYQTCVRQATLISCAGGLAAIGVSDTRTKDTLEFGYLGALGLALGDALGREVEVRFVIYQPTVRT